MTAANTTLNRSVQYADRTNSWHLEQGEAFPFLGFADGMAYLRIGKTWIMEPATTVHVVRGAEHPETMAKYQTEMVQVAAENAAAANKIADVSSDFKEARARGDLADVTPIVPINIRLKEELTFPSNVQGNAPLVLEKGSDLVAVAMKDNQYVTEAKGVWILIPITNARTRR